MQFSLHQILNVLTISWLIFSSVFLLITPKGKKSKNRLLAALLLTNAIFNLTGMAKPYLHDSIYLIKLLLFIGTSTGFLFGPLIYFYSKANFTSFKTSTKSFLFAFFPFIASILFYSFGFYRNYEIYLITVMYLHIITYIILSLVHLSNYKSNAKKELSNIEFGKLNRLLFVFVIFFSLWLLDIFLVLKHFNLFISSISHEQIFIFLILINLFFAIFIVLDLMLHPEMFDLLEVNQKREKYTSSSLKENDKTLILNKLTLEIKSNLYYKDPNLTISKLSKLTNIPSRSISQVINELREQNFYDFINSYRISDAKKLLELNKGKNILEIALECGFNSKSSFNSSFKKFTNQTPTEYRNNRFK